MGYELYKVVLLILHIGNVVNAVHHARVINREIRMAAAMDDSELFSYAKQLQVPVDLLRQTAKLGRLPVVNFAAGGLGNSKTENINLLGSFFLHLVVGK